MKYKTAIQYTLMAQVFSFICIAAFFASMAIEGLDKFILEIKDSTAMKILFIFASIVILPATLFTLVLASKLETLTKIEDQEALMEKEKEQFKQATDAFVKTFNVKSANLL